MFMHTKMYTQDITRPSFCTQGLGAKPTETIAPAELQVHTIKQFNF